MGSKFNEAIEKIHYGVNPYVGFEYTAADLDPQGWNSNHPFFEEWITKLKPSVIVEVGSWKGGSARHMASIVRKLNLDAVVICVDTWLAEEVLWSREEWRQSLRFKNGRPTVYTTFMANTVNEGYQDIIVPLSMPSLAGRRYLGLRDITADFVYIDGSHIEGDVIRDLEAYWSMLRKGGVILIDDYTPHEGMFHGLVKDVDKFAREKNIEKIISGEKCLFVKK